MALSGIEMLMSQFGITPEKLAEMVKPITDAIQQLDANNAERINSLSVLITTRFDLLEQLVREQGGDVEAAGEGATFHNAAELLSNAATVEVSPTPPLEDIETKPQ
jgi:hypothetical protein